MTKTAKDLTPDLKAIRKRLEEGYAFFAMAVHDVHVLLAHVDGLEAVTEREKFNTDVLNERISELEDQARELAGVIVDKEWSGEKHQAEREYDRPNIWLDRCPFCKRLKTTICKDHSPTCPVLTAKEVLK